MQVKLFNTRIDADLIAADQQAINSFMETVTVKNTATQFVNGSPDFWSILVFYENGETEKPVTRKPVSEKSSSENTDVPLTEEQEQILQALRIWRKDKANELQQPEFMVFSNATLSAVAKTKPRLMNELLTVKGFGQAKLTRYGDDIMAILNAF